MLNLNSDRLATIFGVAIALAEVLGDKALIPHSVATAITSIGIVLLGFVTNKSENLSK